MSLFKRNRVRRSTENLQTKLIEAIGKVGYLKHDAENKFDKYTYPSISLMIGEVRAALVECGILMQVTTKSEECLPIGTTSTGKEQHRHKVVLLVKLTLGDEFLIYNFSGYAHDTGDKACSKAYSMALKQILKIVFLIETGEDDDPDGDSPESQPGLPDIDFEMYPVPKTIEQWFFDNQNKTVDEIKAIVSLPEYRSLDDKRPNYEKIKSAQAFKDEKKREAKS